MTLVKYLTEIQEPGSGEAADREDFAQTEKEEEC